MQPMSPLSQQVRARHSRAESRARIIEATTELVRERSYGELSIGEIMERAGFGRTIFYRHFDDLPDLLIRAGREAIEGLYEAELALERSRTEVGAESVRLAVEAAVKVYSQHGPILRAIHEASASDPQLAPNQAEVRRRFDALVAAALREAYTHGGDPPTDIDETAHALNLMNETYLMDAFGHEPRVTPETAARTLTEVWAAVFNR
jgi:AcrR family transcriptional regulator